MADSAQNYSGFLRTLLNPHPLILSNDLISSSYVAGIPYSTLSLSLSITWPGASCCFQRERPIVFPRSLSRAKSVPTSLACHNHLHLCDIFLPMLSDCQQLLNTSSMSTIHNGTNPAYKKSFATGRVSNPLGLCILCLTP